MNSVSLEGNVVAVPRVSNSNGSRTARFRLRVDKPAFDKNGDNKVTRSYFDIMAWGYLVDALVKEAQPGVNLKVFGALHSKFITTKNGLKFPKTEVEVHTFEINS